MPLKMSYSVSNLGLNPCGTTAAAAAAVAAAGGGPRRFSHVSNFSRFH